MPERKYISVSYEDKDLAKSLGAKWDAEAKSWYVDRFSKLNKIFSWKEPEVIREKIQYSDYEIVSLFKRIDTRFNCAEDIVEFLGIDIDKLVFADKAFCPMCDSNISNEWTIDGRVELRHIWDSRDDGLNSRETFMLEDYLNVNLLTKKRQKLTKALT